MLRTDLEELKREHPNGLNVQTGGCRFCGQIAQIETLLPWDQEMCDEAAAELCDCLEAKAYTREKGQKERARRSIEKQFGQQAEENQVANHVVELLGEIADMVVEGAVSSCTIDIGNGLKAKISVTAKGHIKVERTKTEKNTQEV